MTTTTSSLPTTQTPEATPSPADTPDKESPAPLPPEEENALASLPTPPQPGEVVEGTVIGKDTRTVYIDLPPWGTGIIYGREYLAARDVLRRVRPGDTIQAQVVDPHNDEGYIELSLREARRAQLWAEAEQAAANRQIFELEVKDANKGGLLLEWRGIPGFLPASQLTPDHYPRVEGGSKEKVFQELQKFVGHKLFVSILTVNEEEGKLIFTERSAAEARGEEMPTPEQEHRRSKKRSEASALLEKYEVDQIVEGEITGVVDFGIFIKLEEGLEGLAHLSELSWGLVTDPRNLFSVGQHVRAKIIDIKDGKVSLSIKRLTPDPWIEAAHKYRKGQRVDAVIIKHNRHGALASVEEGVAGLVPASEFPSTEVLRQTLNLGERYPFTIVVFEPAERRLILSYAGPKPWEENND